MKISFLVVLVLKLKDLKDIDRKARGHWLKAFSVLFLIPFMNISDVIIGYSFFPAYIRIDVVYDIIKKPIALMVNLGSNW